MAKRSLSDVPEEAAYLRADDRCERMAGRLAPMVRRRLAECGALHDPMQLAVAVATRSVSGARMAFDPKAVAMRWSALLAPERVEPVQKARRPKPTSEEALIAEAVDAGLELGLQTLPAGIRDEVDVESARRLATRRLRQGTFRQSLAALEESQRGLAVLVDADLETVDLGLLRDPARLASIFGLNERQARALLRDAEERLAGGVKRSVVERQLLRRVEQAIQARSELIAQTLGNEAINTAQQALIETARAQGLLDEQAVREWVTRRDARVCERCDAFDGKRATVDGYFESDLGETAFQPLIHPACRCRVRVVRATSSGRKRRAA